MWRQHVIWFFRGAWTPFAALGFLHRHGLWAWATVPIVINVALFVACATTLWLVVLPWLTDVLSHGIVGFFVNTLGWATTDNLALGITHALWWMLLPWVLFAAILVVVGVGQALAAPFLDVLSERVEAICDRRAPRPAGFVSAVKTLFIGIADFFWGLGCLGLGFLPQLALALLPGLGAWLSLAGAAMYVAQQFMGLPLARRHQGFWQRWRFVAAHRWPAMGFGLSCIVVLALPVLGLIALPLATVGGTLLVCDLQKKVAAVDNVPPPPIMPSPMPRLNRGA